MRIPGASVLTPKIHKYVKKTAVYIYISNQVIHFIANINQ